MITQIRTSQLEVGTVVRVATYPADLFGVILENSKQVERGRRFLRVRTDDGRVLSYDVSSQSHVDVKVGA